MPATFTSARFVGREDAFAKLATVLQSATAGDAGTLLLEGTAGIGTTRFMDEVISRVEWRRARTSGLPLMHPDPTGRLAFKHLRGPAQE